MIQYFNNQKDTNSSVTDLSTSYTKMQSRNSNNDMVPGPGLHQGKWTPEEEEYVECLISEFRAGQLPLAEGTSLRIFLSKMLNCNPMRISKKFVNSNYNGKQLYARKPNTLPADEVLKRRTKLQELEQKFLHRVSPLSNLEPPSQQGGVSQNALGSDTTQAIKESPVFQNMQSEAPMFQVGNNFKSNISMSSGRRVNRRAAAAGRALLQGFNSSSLKSDMGVQQNSSSRASLGDISSLEIMAELQRRASGHDLNKMQKSMSFASCSSLELAAADIQRKASSENILGRTLSGNSMSNILDPSLELALQSLVSKNNHSSLSLSNMVERQNSIDSLSSSALFQNGRSMSNLLNGRDGSKSSQESAKNWSFGNGATNSTSANNLSELMMHLSNGSLAQSQQTAQPSLSEMSSTDVNLKELLRNMNSNNRNNGMSNGSRMGSVAREESFAQNMASAASLSDLFNTDSFANSNSSGMQNQTFLKKQQQSSSLPESISNYVNKQRLSNDGQSSTGALFDMLSRNQLLSQTSSASLDQRNDVGNQESSTSGLSLDQIRQLLAKQGNNVGQKRQFNSQNFDDDEARQWKRLR